MRYARLFVDEGGDSHFGDIEIEFTPTEYIESAPPLELSATGSALQFGFMRAPAGWKSDFHVASARSLFIVMTGEWEVTASDGDSRRFAAGSALLVEDRTGKGHSSSVVSDGPSVAAMIQLS
jgi:hypothetical protein